MERFYPFEALITLKCKAPDTYALIKTKVSELENLCLGLSITGFRPEQGDTMHQLAIFLDYIESLADFYSDIRKSYYKVAHTNFFKQKIDGFRSNKTRIDIALALLEDVKQLEK